MLEALLLTAMTGLPSTQADTGRRSRPSLELLEFLGEFGDDEEGLFDTATGARAPADKGTPAVPVKARPPASPPAASPAPVSPPPAGKEHP